MSPDELLEHRLRTTLTTIADASVPHGYVAELDAVMANTAQVVSRRWDPRRTALPSPRRRRWGRVVMAAAILSGLLIVLWVMSGFPGGAPAPDPSKDGRVDPGFSPAGLLPRTGHATVVLEDGRVAVIGGGIDSSGPSEASIEVWVPDIETSSDHLSMPAAGASPEAGFVEAGILENARRGMTATVLHDGRVVIVGGVGQGGMAGAELWDPSQRTTRPAGALVIPRTDHVALLWSDGTVLIVGGDDVSGEAARDPELWDPAGGGFWRMPDQDTVVRFLESQLSHSEALLLADGRVVLVGDDGLAVWDPTSGLVETVLFPDGRRLWPSATLLSDGRVLFVGGKTSIGRGRPPLATALTWDPAGGSWDEVGTMSVGRIGHTATLLPDGKVLIVGGDDNSEAVLASAEIWDPASGAFAPAGSLEAGRTEHSAEALPDGRVLVIGGRGPRSDDVDFPAAIAQAEVWSPGFVSDSGT
jgi:hypothetical protein